MIPRFPPDKPYTRDNVFLELAYLTISLLAPGAAKAFGTPRIFLPSNLQMAPFWRCQPWIEIPIRKRAQHFDPSRAF